VGGKFGKQIEKLGFARKKTDHDTVSWSKNYQDGVLSHASQAPRKETGHVAVFGKSANAPDFGLSRSTGALKGHGFSHAVRTNTVTA
jgi:hypothetical protein